MHSRGYSNTRRKPTYRTHNHKKSFLSYILPFTLIGVIIIVGIGIFHITSFVFSSDDENTATSNTSSQSYVEILAGDATIKHRGSDTQEPLKDGEFVKQGDTIQTATGSRVSILFSDKSLVRLDENTLLEIQELSLTPESRKTQLFLYYGRSWSRILQPFSHEESFYRVDTDDTVSRALGTVFSVAYNKDTKESFLEVLESEVKFELKNPNDLSSNREVRKIDSIIVSEGYSSSIDHDEITEYEEKRKNLESHKDNMNDGMWNSWNMLEDKTFLENEKEALEASLKEYQKQTVSQQIINTFTGDESITENKTLYLHIQDQIRKLPLEEERKLWMKKSNAESIKDLVDQDNKDQQDSSDNTESDISDTLDSSTNATSSSNSFIQKTPLSLEYYTIDPGESLSSIGIYYDIDWEELAEINNISDPYPVFVGQKLKLTSEMQDKIQAKDAAVAAKKKAQESWSKNNTTDDQGAADNTQTIKETESTTEPTEIEEKTTTEQDPSTAKENESFQSDI